MSYLLDTCTLIWLVNWRAKQDMDCVARNFCDCPLMRKHDIRHSCQIFIEKFREQTRVKRFHQCCKTRDVSEDRSDLAAPSCQTECTRVADEQLS